MSFFSEGMRAKGGEWRTAGATGPWTGEEEEADERGRGILAGSLPRARACCKFILLATQLNAL